jgi:hypothetical protein
MTPEERDLITGLFNRLRNADTQAHDADAEQIINQAVAAQPGAPYLLAQTVLVQEHALANAQGRIAQLEKQLAAAASQPAPSGGSFLSGLLGRSASPAPLIAPSPLPSAAPYPSTVNLPSSAGGSFLRSALTTAAGVAGGALLFQGVEDLLGHHAGAFGSYFGGGGGGFLNAGYGGGRPEIIENNEVINNNYYGDSGGAGFARDPGGREPSAIGDDPAFEQNSAMTTSDDDGYGTPQDDFMKDTAADADLGMGDPNAGLSDDTFSGGSDGTQV